MSDLERAQAFFDSLGIKYSVAQDGAIITVTFGCECYGEEYDGYPKCDKVGGYPRFYSRYNFDASGAFIDVEMLG